MSKTEKQLLQERADELELEYTQKTTVLQLKEMIATAESPDEGEEDEEVPEDEEEEEEEESEEDEGEEDKEGDDNTDDIEVSDPIDLRPKNLPLVVKLPAGASSAQVEYAKILNSYAYCNPDKWQRKKGTLIRKLRSLAGRELPDLEGEERPNRLLEMNRAGFKASPFSFNFLKDEAGAPIPVLPDNDE